MERKKVNMWWFKYPTLMFGKLIKNIIVFTPYFHVKMSAVKNKYWTTQGVWNKMADLCKIMYTVNELFINYASFVKRPVIGEL